MCLRKTGCYICAFLWGLLHAAAHAEEPAADPIVAPPLIVTTTGLKTPRAAEPGNTAVLDTQTIDFTSAQHPAQSLNKLPGVNIHRGSGQEHLTAIRSPVLTGGAGAGSFLYLEDGIPLRAAGFANVNGLFESVEEVAEEIEVVRGPGSALYGSNAVHGVVNILSRAPSPDFELFRDARFGPHGSRRVALSFSPGAEILDTATGAARFSLVLKSDDGYRDSSGFDQYKGQLRYDYEADDLYVKFLASAHHLNQQTAAYVRGTDAYKDDALRRTNPAPDAFRKARGVRVQGRIEYTPTARRRIVITPYLRRSAMRFLMHFIPGTPTEQNEHTSLGTRGVLHVDFAGGHKIAFGLEVEATDGSLSEVQTQDSNIASLPIGTHYDYRVREARLALFTQNMFRIAPRLDLHAGLRLDWTRDAYTNRTDTGVLGRFLRPDDRADNFFAATPKLGLVYRASDTYTLFANWVSGARAPQTTDLYRLQSQQRPGEIDTEKLESFEIGLRAQYETARFEATGFHMRKRRFHFRDADGFTVSDGRTKHAGLEIEAEVPLPWTMFARVSASYARHLYDFDRPAMRAGETIMSGDDIDTAPRRQLNAALGFASGRWRGEIEWVHSGRYHTNAANTRSYPGHNIVNLRAQLRLLSFSSLTVRVLNLTDRDYAERADFAFGSDRYFPGEPRSLYLGLQVKF